MAAENEAYSVKRKEDLAVHNGEIVIVFGLYCSIVAPRKGWPSPKAPKDRAVIILKDGTRVFLESIDSPKSIRPPEEREHFNGKMVKGLGTIYRIMPSRGESLIAPCLCDIIFIEELQ
jgi:hypothetical protein